MSLSIAIRTGSTHHAISSSLEVKSVRDLDIAEVAQRSGVPASALRFYEEKGLIRSIGRRGLRRLFDPGVIEQLALIALGQASGFSLDEIAGMFPRSIARCSPPRRMNSIARSASSRRCATGCATRRHAPIPAIWNARPFARFCTARRWHAGRRARSGARVKAAARNAARARSSRRKARSSARSRRRARSRSPRHAATAAGSAGTSAARG